MILNFYFIQFKSQVVNVQKKDGTQPNPLKVNTKLLNIIINHFKRKKEKTEKIKINN